MKLTIVVVALFACIFLCDCHPESGSKFKKGCTVDGIFIEAGSELTVPGKCQLTKCTGLNKVVTTACQEKTKEEKCFKKNADISKPFPDCCPQWICN